MGPLVSVIICAHNPRKDYLARVLKALSAQTLPVEQWELLLVDNASEMSLAQHWDLSWHPHARHVREGELGSAPAKLRGMKESNGELMVFVDDDNVLCANYLETAVGISYGRPYLGAFGASTVPEFEKTPPESIKKYLAYLAVDEIKEDYWGNVTFGTSAFPFGAGLCVRRSVASAYRELVDKDPRRQRLGRVGNALGGHEDHDLTLCALDLGMGTGRFHALRLTHLINKGRLTEDYIVRLISEGAGSMLLLSSFRNLKGAPSEPKWVEMAKLCWRLARAGRFERKIILATHRTTTRAGAALKLDG